MRRVRSSASGGPRRLDPPYRLRLKAETIEIALGPHVNAAVHDGRRGEYVLVERCRVQHLPLWFSAQHGGIALLTEQVHLAVAGDGRGVVIAGAAGAGFLGRLAGLGVEGSNDAAVA